MTRDVTVLWADLEGLRGAPPGSLLSADERRRAASFRFTRDREQFVVARGLLRKLLGERLGTDPKGIEIAYGEHGKPRLADDAAGLSFNVSHSAGVAVFAFCEGAEVGVDIEAIREKLAAERIARRYLPPEAAERIERSEGSDRAREFFRAWARQEAYVKGRGRGLELIGERPAGWSISDLGLADGYAAALAVEGTATVRVSARPL
jgi:4'-phosphopantetheinyl transferase